MVLGSAKSIVSSTRETPICGDVGFNVRAADAKPGTLLLRRFSAVKAGPVVAAFNGGRFGKFLLPGERLDLTLGGENSWSLHAFGTVRPAVGAGRGGSADHRLPSSDDWPWPRQMSSSPSTVSTMMPLPQSYGRVIWTPTASWIYSPTFQRTMQDATTYYSYRLLREPGNCYSSSLAHHRRAA